MLQHCAIFGIMIMNKYFLIESMVMTGEVIGRPLARQDWLMKAMAFCRIATTVIKFGACDLVANSALASIQPQMQTIRCTYGSVVWVSRPIEVMESGYVTSIHTVVSRACCNKDCGINERIAQ